MGFLSDVGKKIKGAVKNPVTQFALHPTSMLTGGLGFLGASALGGDTYRGPSSAALQKRRAQAYSAEQIGLENRRAAEGQQRERALADLDRAYASPERMAGMERLYGANLQNELAGINQGYRQQSQDAGLAAARRGRLGSSTDAETQARLQASLQGDVMDAESRTFNQLQNLRQADQNQLQALRRSILAGDPQAAASLQAQATGYGIDASRILQSAREQEEARRRAEESQARNYATLGNMLSSGAQGVQNYYYGRGF